MRSKFIEHTASMAGALDASAINAYLNRAYRFTIPSDIDGPYFDTTWQLTTAAGTASYAMPAWVVVPHGTAWINLDSGSPVSIGLDVVDDATQFEAYYGLQTTNARPTAILMRGRTVTLAPAPDAVYGIAIPVRGGADADLADGGSIADEILALAVVRAAAAEYLTEQDDADGVGRNQAAYAVQRDLLLTRSLAMPRARRAARSF